MQVEAITNRPLSIARRHLAASQLRMREIEPDELSSSEWVRFLVMEGRERDRWILDFQRRRRDSSGSSSSQDQDDMDTAPDPQTAYDKAEEARLEAEEARREEQRSTPASAPISAPPSNVQSASGSTPFVSLWARHLDELERNERTDTVPTAYSARQPMHARRAVDFDDAPPAYNTVVSTSTPPPAYEPRCDNECGNASSGSRIRRWSSNYLATRF